jgi:hypothetical protein
MGCFGGQNLSGFASIATRFLTTMIPVVGFIAP